MEAERKTFLELGGGAALERVDYELARVVENILDPNTPAAKPRKITVTVTYLPDEDRSLIRYDVSVKTALQPTYAIAGAASVYEGAGGVQLVELVPQAPGQLDFAGGEQRPPGVIDIKRLG